MGDCEEERRTLAYHASHPSLRSMSALFTWMRLKKRGRPSLYPLNENATRSFAERKGDIS